MKKKLCGSNKYNFLQFATVQSHQSMLNLPAAWFICPARRKSILPYSNEARTVYERYADLLNQHASIELL